MYTFTISRSQIFKTLGVLIPLITLMIAIDGCKKRNANLAGAEQEKQVKLFIANNDQCKRICERFRNYLEVSLPKKGIEYPDEISDVLWDEIKRTLWQIIITERSEIAARSPEGVILSNLSREKYPHNRYERDFNNFRFKYSTGDYTLKEMIDAAMQYIQGIQSDLQGEMLKDI